ncbi:MAG: class I SAM-dependent methyltransferase [Proteobacteria bacterium]|nr:class I SAM-dependent methyltransferase [Pseudomonadota bacterium]
MVLFLAACGMLAGMSPLMEIARGWCDYRLIDSGDGRKLEEVGGLRFIRPEATALWSPHLADSAWQNPSGIFVPAASSEETSGKWQLTPQVPARWEMAYDGMRFWAAPTPFRHFGFFPEQASHWQWCDALLAKRHQPRLLNLFAYSGLASLYAARKGAQVTHIDSSKKAIDAAFANRSKAEMDHAPIRFIIEDASKFVDRELRRGNRYDCILLDPPKYGRGNHGEIWRLESDLPPLMKKLAQLLSDTPVFIVVTAYAIRASCLSLHHLLAETVTGFGGKVTSGELCLREDREGGRIIPQAIFARWQAHDGSADTA